MSSHQNLARAELCQFLQFWRKERSASAVRQERRGNATARTAHARQHMQHCRAGVDSNPELLNRSRGRRPGLPRPCVARRRAKMFAYCTHGAHCTTDAKAFQFSSFCPAQFLVPRRWQLHQICTTGTLSVLVNYSYHYQWHCTGTHGTARHCSHWHGINPGSRQALLPFEIAASEAMDTVSIGAEVHAALQPFQFQFDYLEYCTCAYCGEYCMIWHPTRTLPVCNRTTRPFHGGCRD